eukprot:PhF_6_TR1476/c0_g2_i1/m.2658
MKKTMFRMAKSSLLAGDDAWIPYLAFELERSMDGGLPKESCPPWVEMITKAQPNCDVLEANEYPFLKLLLAPPVGGGEREFPREKVSPDTVNSLTAAEYHALGNELFKQGEYCKASEKYVTAILGLVADHDYLPIRMLLHRAFLFSQRLHWFSALCDLVAAEFLMTFFASPHRTIPDVLLTLSKKLS